MKLSQVCSGIGRGLRRIRAENIITDDAYLEAYAHGALGEVTVETASGTSGSAQDREDGLGPKGAGPAPEGGDAQ